MSESADPVREMVVSGSRYENGSTTSPQSATSASVVTTPGDKQRAAQPTTPTVDAIVQKQFGAHLAPGLVSAAFSVEIPANSDPPHPLEVDEFRFVEGASAARVRQFAAGRACARAAALQLTGNKARIHRDERAPLWPPGIVGSISHTAINAIAIALMANTPGDRSIGVGVDRESIGRVGSDIEGRIVSQLELDELPPLDHRRRDEALTAIFAAKESFYKAQWPLRRTWVGFLDVRAVVSLGAQGGMVTLTPTGSMDLSDVSWPIHANYSVATGDVTATLAATIAPA